MKDIKSRFINELKYRFGRLQKLEGSLSLYKIGDSNVHIYIRYSKPHPGNKTWFGLREKDLLKLEGYASFLCFLWDTQEDPLIVPFADFEDIFHSTTPAEDGQYKVQITTSKDITELYLARVGKFNVEGYFGWNILTGTVEATDATKIPELSHSQIQTYLGAIGSAKEYDIWIPLNDRSKINHVHSTRLVFREQFPGGFENIDNILQEVDVIWFQRGSNQLVALYEVEHSTPIYSGLLRFNDLILSSPSIRPRFNIVSYNDRRSLFIRQLRRPTFQTSGLDELCTFLEYSDVYNWHQRLFMRK